MAIRSLRSLAYEDLSVGLSELVMKTVTDQDVVGFADISGDQNPIHLCDLYASRTRFGQRIAEEEMGPCAPERASSSVTPKPRVRPAAASVVALPLRFAP